MDFDYTTILYVILGIIYFIFTGVNKNKKKAQGRAAKNPQPGTETLGPPPVSRRPTFEELLEEFTGGEKTIIPEPEPEPAFQEVVVAEPVNKYPLRFEPKEKIKEVAPLMSFKAYDELVEVERENYAEMFSDLDGAKRAFIASEIFQRKY